MKKLLLFFAAILPVLLTACNDSVSPTIDNEIDADDIKYISIDGSVATYEMTDLDWFVKPDNEDWRAWGESPDDQILDYSSPMPSTICFQNGKVWELLDFSHYGISHNPLRTAWNAYCYKTKTDIDLYITKDLLYDEENKTLFINKEFLTVIDYNEKQLELEYTSYMSHTGYLKECAHYKLTSPLLLGPDTALLFESEYEVFTYMAKKCRELFGESLNLNVLYADWVILDDPIVYMDDVDVWVEQFKPADE